jgi:type VI protein secretion system component VasF
VLLEFSVSGKLISEEGTMGAESPNDIDRAAIEEHAQRTVERQALRKVRHTLDTIEEDEAAKRRTLRYVLIACAILAVVGAWFFWGLLFGGRDMPQAPPMKVPSTLPQKQ